MVGLPFPPNPTDASADPAGTNHAGLVAGANAASMAGGRSRQPAGDAPPQDVAVANPAVGPLVAPASQSRRDALTGRWAIFAPGRSERPAEIGDADLPRQAGHSCPFCGGHEQYTPPASLEVCEPSKPRGEWSVRVVPNLFPAVSQNQPGESLLDKPCDRPSASAHHPPACRCGEDGCGEGNCGTLRSGNSETFTGGDGATPRPAECSGGDAAYEDGDGTDDLFEVNELHGGHEVVIETPSHLESLTDLSQVHAGRVFEAYAARMRHWYDVPGVQYVVTFKNVGAAAGASLRHTHSQVIATSLLPPSVTEIGRRVESHFQRSECCLMCATLAGELEDGRRIVLESERFIAYCPFASRMPYLVRIAPRTHADRFETTAPERLEELAGLVQGVLRSLESTFVPCAYNYTIHTRPRNVASPSSFHWWMELFPRLTKVAGFEWSSDCFINPVPPETAAMHLRRERCGRIKRTLHRNSAEFSD